MCTGLRVRNSDVEILAPTAAGLRRRATRGCSRAFGGAPYSSQCFGNRDNRPTLRHFGIDRTSRCLLSYDAYYMSPRQHAAAEIISKARKAIPMLGRPAFEQHYCERLLQSHLDS